jgi:hypothetical protein
METKEEVQGGLDWDKIFKDNSSLFDDVTLLETNSISIVAALHLLYVSLQKQDKSSEFQKLSEALIDFRLDTLFPGRKIEFGIVRFSEKIIISFDFIQEVKRILPKLSEEGRKQLFQYYFNEQTPENNSNEMEKVILLLQEFKITIYYLPFKFFHAIYLDDSQSDRLMQYKNLMSKIWNHVENFNGLYPTDAIKEYNSENKEGISTRYDIFGKFANDFDAKFLFEYGKPSNIMRIKDKTIFQNKNFFNQKGLSFHHQSYPTGEFNVNVTFAIRHRWINPFELLDYFKNESMNFKLKFEFILNFLPVQKDNNEILDFLNSQNIELSPLLTLQYNSSLVKRKMERLNQEKDDTVVFHLQNRIRTRIENDFKKFEQGEPLTLLSKTEIECLFYIEDIYLSTPLENRICNEETLLKFFLKRTLINKSTEQTISTLITVQHISSLGKEFLLLLLMNVNIRTTFFHSNDQYNLYYIYLDCGGSVKDLMKRPYMLTDVSDPYLDVLYVVMNSLDWKKKVSETQKQNFLLFMNYQLEMFKTQNILVEQLGYDLPLIIQMYLNTQDQKQNPKAKELFRDVILYFDEKQSIKLFKKFQFMDEDQSLPQHQHASLCTYASSKFSKEKTNLNYPRRESVVSLKNLEKSFELYCYSDPTYIPSRSQIFLFRYLENWYKSNKNRKEEKEKEEEKEEESLHILTFVQKNKISSLTEIIGDWIANPKKHTQILNEWQQMMKSISDPKDSLIYECIAFVEFIFQELLKEKRNEDNKETSINQKRTRSEELDQKESSFKKAKISTNLTSSSMTDID